MVKTITEKEAQDLLKEYLETRSNEDQRALCCLLGAYCGDNLGNYNEFSHSITEKELDEAMKMPGDGAHNLIPGQSTDDTELATSMAYGIIENSDPKVFDCNLISKYYAIWLQSPPFDLGMTIGAALGANRKEALAYNTNAENCKQRKLAQRNRYSTQQQNRHSQSNGGLMRISPLCVFLSKQTDQNLIRRIVYAEQTLTHISKQSLEAAYVYVRLVTNLIKGMTATQAHEDLSQYFKKECEEEEVKEWWEQKQKKEEYDNAVTSMGWVKHGLTQCFVALKQLSQIEQAYEGEDFKKEVYKSFLRDILKLCGDSDTNGAIVGGMIGAYLTLKDFPGDYVFKIVNCNLQDKTNSQLWHKRQEIYNPRNCIYLCNEILKKASNSQDIDIIDEKLTDQDIKQIQYQNELKMQQINEAYKNKIQSEEGQGTQQKSQKSDNSIQKGSILAYFKQLVKEKQEELMQEQNQEINENVEEAQNQQLDSIIQEEETAPPHQNELIEEQKIEEQQEVNEI